MSQRRDMGTQDLCTPTYAQRCAWMGHIGSVLIEEELGLWNRTEIEFYSADSWLSMRRCSARRDMELIRFCTLTMPTTRPLSVTGMRERPCPAEMRRMVVPRVSSGRATWKARDITPCT